MTIDNLSSCLCSSQTSATNPFKQQFEDFKSLDKAVQSGDLSSASTALSAYQQDIQNAPANSPLAKLFADGTPASKDLQALQTAIQNNDTTGAQKAMASLKQDLQSARKTHGHHHHHRADNDGDADDSGAAAGASSSSGTTTTNDTTSTSSSAVNEIDLLA